MRPTKIKSAGVAPAIHVEIKRDDASQRALHRKITNDVAHTIAVEAQPNLAVGVTLRLTGEAAPENYGPMRSDELTVIKQSSGRLLVEIVRGIRYPVAYGAGRMFEATTTLPPLPGALSKEIRVKAPCDGISTVRQVLEDLNGLIEKYHDGPIIDDHGDILIPMGAMYRLGKIDFDRKLVFMPRACVWRKKSGANATDFTMNELPGPLGILAEGWMRAKEAAKAKKPHTPCGGHLADFRNIP